MSQIQRVRTFLAFHNSLQISFSFVEISHLSFQLERGGGVEFTMDGTDSLISGLSCLLCLNRKKKTLRSRSTLIFRRENEEKIT